MSIYNFQKLTRVPHNGYIINMNEMKKIIFSVSGARVGENTTIGIDMENRGLYYNVKPIKMGKIDPSKILEESDLEYIKSVVFNCNVSNWKEFYEDNEEVMDGFAWTLCIEGEEGLVEKHVGCGTSKNKVTPEEFEEFEKSIYRVLDKEILNK